MSHLARRSFLGNLLSLPFVPSLTEFEIQPDEKIGLDKTRRIMQLFLIKESKLWKCKFFLNYKNCKIVNGKFIEFPDIKQRRLKIVGIKVDTPPVICWDFGYVTIKRPTCLLSISVFDHQNQFIKSAKICVNYITRLDTVNLSYAIRGDGV